MKAMKNFPGSMDFKVCNSCISECYLGMYFRKNTKGVNQEEENRIRSNSKGNSRKTAIQGILQNQQSSWEGEDRGSRMEDSEMWKELIDSIQRMLS